MKNLYKKEAVDEILSRLQKLNSESQHQWGKMEVDQMLAHCIEAMRSALGDSKPPRVFLGYIIGPLFKSAALNEKPMQKNSPTAKSFIIQDRRDFNSELDKLKNLIIKFNKDGEGACTDHPHSFFGNLTPDEWARLQYKHLDHHLNQFGV